MKICDFVNSEIEFILSESNFTEDERILFLMRTKDIPLESCAEQMNLSISAVKSKSRKVNNKIKKVMKR